MDPLQRMAFCVPGTPFFDLPMAKGDDYPRASADVPEGWHRYSDQHWVWQGPESLTLPAQGWKVHVSATVASAERVLETVWDYCLGAGLPFKFIRSQQVLLRRNSKYGDRSASGKFVTIYPVGDEQLERVLHELGGLLDGETGPYILSDVRWRSGPLYVRYGAFLSRTTRSPSGELVHCIEDPEGNLVPDRRSPGFHPPSWVRLPAVLEEAVAARNAGGMKDFPYKITGALHFSNGGGVYRGTDTRTGEEVLVREARPLAGEDHCGNDAIFRQERERWAMERLAGLEVIPRLRDFRKGYEHQFLVRDYVQGTTLGQLMNTRNPLCRPATGASVTPSAAELERYTAWALDIVGQVEAGLQQMHTRGVAFGDLHPANILVQDDDAVKFIDLETASDIADRSAQMMAAPGFVAPAGYTGADVDLYALACVKLAVFLPLTTVVPWNAEKVDELLAVVRTSFPVPESYLAGIASVLDAAAGIPSPGATGLLDAASGPPQTVGQQAHRPLWPTDPLQDWPELRGELAAGILASASPDRTDRLFPGDAPQLTAPEGAVNLTTGAAGVLWALDAVGISVLDEHVQWLIDVSRSIREPRAGLYDGLSGVAVTLDRLGRKADAVQCLERVRAADRDGLPSDLSGGLSGIGLTMLHFADEARTELLQDAVEIGDVLRARLATTVTGAPMSPPGLLHGGAGIALFYLRLHEVLGEPEYVDLARQALLTDVAALEAHRKASAQAPGSGLPPLPAAVGIGVGGVAVVIDRLLGVSDGDAETLRAVRTTFVESASQWFQPNAGLFHGRAGAVAALAHLRAGPVACPDVMMTSHLRALGLHAVRYDGTLMFLGHEAMRLSSDLGTGAAGVLLALEAAAGGSAGLPFLDTRTTEGAAQ